MSLFKSLIETILNEGGQAAENLTAKLIKANNNPALKYKRATPTPEILDEIQKLLTILRSRGFIDAQEPSYYLGSSRLFAIKAGLRAPEPNEIETQEIIDKALQTKKDFGDIDLDVVLDDGVSLKDIGEFLQDEYKGKYAVEIGGDEINTAVVVSGTNDVIQIDIVNIKGKEKFFGMTQFASMADMSQGIKGVIRDLMIRSIAATADINPASSSAFDKKIKDSAEYRKFKAANESKGEVGYKIRYSLAGTGLAYRIDWTINGATRSYSAGGIKFDQLQKFLSGEDVQPVAYDDLDKIAAVLGFKTPEHMKHVVKMAELISTFDDNRRQLIWNSLISNLKSKLPNPASGRNIGQISTQEAKQSITYLKPYFGDIDYSGSNSLFPESAENDELSEAVKMTSIKHIDQMSAKDFCNLFSGGAWEVSEKYDGSNVSFGLNENDDIYVKSKKGNPVTNENEFFAMAESYDNDIFRGFGNLLITLKQSGVASLLKGVQESLGSPIQIFGELFSKAHMNVIPYAEDLIGNGAVVFFGVIKLNSPKGSDITTTEDGNAIKNQLIDELNGVNGWNFYDKKPLALDIGEDIKAQLAKTCSAENMAIIASRKRTGSEAEMKARASKEFAELQSMIKKTLLGSLGTVPSSLGAAEIEGAIIRNIETGAIAKLVDLEGFGRRRAEQWAGIDALKDYRKSLYNQLKNDVLNNADIFILDDKQIQKLTDAMEEKKSRFNTLDEMLEVLYGDAASEVEFKEANQMVIDLTSTLNAYKKNIEDALGEIAKDDQKAQDDTLKAIKAERTRIDGFITELNKRILNKQNPYLSVIQFVLGPKSIDEFKTKFMNAVAK
jgi:hypothetical protein